MDGPILISVGSGKGGVGKSLIASNVAVGCAALGMRTVLVDADLGAANQHSLFGLDRAGPTLQALVDRNAVSLEEIAAPTGLARLFLVQGIGAIPGAANLAHASKLKLIRHVRKLEADVVVIDVGAGVSYNVLDFFLAADLRLVVTSPQLPSLQNAYAFLKAAVHRELRHQVADPAQREALERAHARNETERLRDLRHRAGEIDPALEEVFDRVTQGFAARIVGNQLENDAQGKVIQALSRMAADFLELRAPVAALVASSRSAHDSVSRRRPLLCSHACTPEARSLQRLVESLLTEDVHALRARRALKRQRGLGAVCEDLGVEVEAASGLCG